MAKKEVHPLPTYDKQGVTPHVPTGPTGVAGRSDRLRRLPRVEHRRRRVTPRVGHPRHRMSSSLSLDVRLIFFPLSHAQLLGLLLPRAELERARAARSRRPNPLPSPHRFQIAANRSSLTSLAPSSTPPRRAPAAARPGNKGSSAAGHPWPSSSTSTSNS